MYTNNAGKETVLQHSNTAIIERKKERAVLYIFTPLHVATDT